MSKKVLFCLAVFAFLATPLALALEPRQASPWTTETTYEGKLTGKLGFGFKNFLFGWTELFSEPYQAYKEKSNVAKGLGRGIGNTIFDTVGGALHIATFPLDKVDIQLPEGGTDNIS